MKSHWARSLLNACRDAAQALFGELPLLEAYEHIATRFQQATQLPWIAISEVDHEANVVRYPPAQCRKLGLPRSTWPLEETTYTALAVQRKEPIYAPQVDDPGHPLVLALNASSIYVLPIFSESLVVATLSIGTNQPLPDEVLEDCKMLGDFLSDCMNILSHQRLRNRDLRFLTDQLQQEARERQELERELRALSAHVNEVQEQERARLARELHDELGQLLTAAKVNVSLLQDLVAPNPETLDRLAVLEQVVATTLETVRDMARRLRPALLDEVGLNAALQWHAQDFCQRSCLDYSIACELRSCLAEAASLALFRIGQEALTNVARHAKASRVWVRLWEDEQHVYLQVRDNGRGMDSIAFGFGLTAIRERALQVKGQAIVESAAGQGLTVTVRLPLPPNRCQNCGSSATCRYPRS